jgi:hypothetical protein
MNWRKASHSDPYQLSEDGRYSVCRVMYAQGERFESWRTRAHPDGPHCVGTGFRTSQQAREAAEGDSDGAA